VETGVIRFHSDGDFRGQAVVSLNYPGKDDKVVIYGRDGTIVFNPLIENTLVVEKYERQTWVLGKDLPYGKLVFRYDEGNNLRSTIEYFSKVLQGKAESNVETAVEITRILEDLQ
jgi:predicted dehydrogenase